MSYPPEQDAPSRPCQLHEPSLHYSRQPQVARNRTAFLGNSTRSYAKASLPKKRSHVALTRPSSGKQWDPIFSTVRQMADRKNAKVHRELLQWVKKEQNNYSSDSEHSAQEASTCDEDAAYDEEELLDNLLADCEGSIPSFEERVVRQFFQQHPSIPQNSTPGWAWLDDRNYKTGSVRDKARPLSSQDLRAALNEERFGHSHIPDADRRLIYISKLTPDYILALSETALNHQIEPLREAICKHITLQTSFRVHIPMRAYTDFRLEFHFAYLMLREGSACVASGTDDTVNGKTSILDLSFLSSSSNVDNLPRLSIYQAHISVVICGWTNSQWTGYAFANTSLSSETFEEPCEDEPRHDFFASDNTCDYTFDADRPYWDARNYWLRIVGIRCQLVLKEWQYLVKTVEENIERKRADDPCSIGNSSTLTSPSEIQKSLNWTLQAMQLLRKLRDTLSEGLQAYKRFNARDGDKCYFSDLQDPEARRMQNSIKESFEKMADLYSKLKSLDDSCERFATHLGRILDLESIHLTAQSNTLNHESNKLNSQSRDIQEQTQELTRLTITLNTEIRKLNEESAAAARANQKAAANTSHSTRVSVELLLLTTPFGMVLQYFGAEKDIFTFSRNPKTFVLATIVLMLILRLLVLFLGYSERLGRLLPWKHSIQFRRAQPMSEPEAVLRAVQP